MAQVGHGSHRSLMGINIATVRQRNRSAVFEAIRHYAPISRKTLALHTGLNPATVTHIVEDLLKANLVVEDTRLQSVTTARHAAGRRPTGLQINADACYLIGINLTRTQASVVLANLAAEVIAHQHFTVSLFHSAEMQVSRVLQLVEHTIAESGLPSDRLRGIGVGAPGPLNTRTGTILASTFPGWVGVPFKQLLEERFGLPVAIDNDANTAALAEQWFGAGRELANFAFVAVGVGVGAGIIVDGHLFQAGGDLNPEFGHTSVQTDGPLCACGNRGCLELYTGTPHLVAHTVELIRRGGASCLASLVPAATYHAGLLPDPLHEDFDALTPACIWHAVECGDALATATVTRTVDYLAAGLSNLVALFHPTVIFIGHDMAGAGPRTFALLRAALAARGVPESIQVIPTRLDDSIPALGAVTLAIRDLFGAPGF